MKTSQYYRKLVRDNKSLVMVLVLSHGRRVLFYFKKDGRKTKMYRLYTANLRIMSPYSSVAFNKLYDDEVLRGGVLEEVWQVCDDTPESIEYAATCLLREADKCNARRAAVRKLKCQS